MSDDYAPPPRGSWQNPNSDRWVPGDPVSDIPAAVLNRPPSDGPMPVVYTYQFELTGPTTFTFVGEGAAFIDGVQIHPPKKAT